MGGGWVKWDGIGRGPRRGTKRTLTQMWSDTTQKYYIDRIDDPLLCTSCVAFSPPPGRRRPRPANGLLFKDHRTGRAHGLGDDIEAGHRADGVKMGCDIFM